MLFKPNFYILTGAMGAGKSTLINQLRQVHQINCVEEPAREILKEQRTIHGEGTPETDPSLFSKLMLSRSIGRYYDHYDLQEITIFDRGIPDNIAYFNFFKINYQAAIKASLEYRYSPTVFFLEGWHEIYSTDDERKMTFQEAYQFGQEIKKIYLELNYQIKKVPFDSPMNRAKWILENI